MFSAASGDDFLDEFMEYDFTMGADVVKCPHCGAEAQCSLFIVTCEIFFLNIRCYIKG